MARGFNAGERQGFGAREYNPRIAMVGRTSSGAKIYKDDDGNEWTSDGRDLAEERRQSEAAQRIGDSVSANSAAKAAMETSAKLKETSYPPGSLGDMFKQTYNDIRKRMWSVYADEEKAAAEEIIRVAKSSAFHKYWNGPGNIGGEDRKYQAQAEAVGEREWEKHKDEASNKYDKENHPSVRYDLSRTSEEKKKVIMKEYEERKERDLAFKKRDFVQDVEIEEMKKIRAGAEKQWLEQNRNLDVPISKQQLLTDTMRGVAARLAAAYPGAFSANGDLPNYTLESPAKGYSPKVVRDIKNEAASLALVKTAEEKLQALIKKGEAKPGANFGVTRGKDGWRVGFYDRLK